MITLGLGHRIQAGKDEVAKILIRRYGFVRRGFADALKEEVLERLPLTLNAVARSMELEPSQAVRECLVWELKPPIVRALLQEYGTEVRRRDDEEYWTKKWVAWVRARLPDRVVATDVRFESEARVVRYYMGHTVRVQRASVEARPITHESEAAGQLIAWDYVLCNDGSLEDLERAVDALMAQLKLEPR